MYMLCCRRNLAALVNIVCHPPWRNYAGRNAQIEKVANTARMYIVPHRAALQSSSADSHPVGMPSSSEEHVVKA